MVGEADICWLSPCPNFPESLIWRKGGKEEIYWILSQAGELNRIGKCGKAQTKQNGLETHSGVTR